jgi:2'-5' RNA ligase
VQSQFAGIGVFADPEVQKALKLTDEQKTAMKKIADEARKELEGLGGLKPENFLKARAIQKQSFEKAVTLLTEDQKKAWKDLLGKPFELKLDIPRPPQ